MGAARQSLFLFVTYLLFLIFGGFLFMLLERELVEDQITVDLKEWARLKDILSNRNVAPVEDELNTLLKWLLGRCSNLPPDIPGYLTSQKNTTWIQGDIERRCSELRIDSIEMVYDYRMSYIDAVYFSMTVATTIGYGFHLPGNSISRIVCMLYALVGIPFTGILLAWTSDIFGERLFALYKSKLDPKLQRTKSYIILGTIVYIVIGFGVFIFLPAIIFHFIEDDWSYLDAVYYAFITLTTIGFGDLVTGQSMTGTWLYVYQFSVILWIMVGLGYWVMVANFITRALKSKKMHDLALKAAELKKMMMKLRMSNSDQEFVSQRSKATLNLMLQLSSALACPEMLENEQTDGSSSPLEIPGISSLFGKENSKIGPSQFFSQMLGTTIAPPKPKDTKQTNDEHSIIDSPEIPSDSSGIGASASLLVKESEQNSFSLPINTSNELTTFESAVIYSKTSKLDDDSSEAGIEDLPNDPII